MPRSHHYSRRRFLQTSALMGAGMVLIPACGGSSTDPLHGGPEKPGRSKRGHLGTVIGPGRAMDKETGQLAYFVGILNLDAEIPQVKLIRDIDFFGHGVTPNPVKPKTAVIFQKHGKGSCEVDLENARVLRKIETVHEREFYGHGAFTPDGKTLFCTEAITGDDSYDGVVAVRDGESFELTGTFPTYGIAPHDCRLIEDGNTLVITNGGGPVGHDDKLPSVTYVDVKTRQLKTELKFSTPRINAGHLDMTSRGELVVVSAPRDGMDESKPDFLGAISFYAPGGKMRTAHDPIGSKMISETLSVAIHEPTMVVGATNPKGNLVTFWDFETGRLVKAIEGEIPNPRGISVTLDGRYFAVTYDDLTHLILIDAQTLEPVRDSYLESTYISGSHNITYDLPA